MRKGRLLQRLLPATLLVTGCQGTWVMYDTDQMDHIYFSEAKQTHIASFALVPEDEISLATTVYLMGQPAPYDRECKYQLLEADEGETLETGGVEYAVKTARPGLDYEVGAVIIPAGETSCQVTITLKRTPEMLTEGQLLKVGLKLVDNENFLTCAPDSSKTTAILTPYFYAYVSDGEPSCPSWWRNTSGGVLGWHFNLGNFYPDKYRRLLQYFHETEATNPSFFQWASSAYGYYLDSPDLAYYSGTSTGSDEDKKVDMMNTFWRKRYSSAWAKYVFMPLYNYYKEKYDQNPDDPSWERMGAVNQNARQGWADPYDSSYGFFN